MSTTSRYLHDGWIFQQTDATPIPNSKADSWLPAIVPGQVHLDLQRNGVIPNPFDGMNERGVQWVDDASWAYWNKFEVSDEELADARHVLVFEGLDTIATVLLNNKEIGATDNMFIAHEFDVTEALKAGANTLEVRFASADATGEARKAGADEEFSRVPARSFVRKAQYMWGWDWGPRLRGCGIWRPVRLVRVPNARVTDWSWRSTFDGASATVAVEVDVEGNAREVSVAIVGNGAEVSTRAAVVNGVATASLTIDNAERWWCVGQGEPTLYDLTIALDDEDVVDARIGLREIELVQEPDDAGKSFFFRINGVPIFAKGANWIPDDSFPSRTTSDRVRAVLQRAVDCGMNMIRIWGGGLYESEEFYDACDELGLLVWQDFPFACALYPDDDATVAALVPEFTAAVKRIRNHASLALWCGNNENQWLGAMGAFGGGPRLLGDRLYDDVLPSVVAEHDPGRDYWPGSPWGSDFPGGDHDGDAHYWNVWHGEGDWVHYVKCTSRFVSEFGFAAPPDERTLRAAIAPEHLGVDTPVMRWHDKTNKGYDTYLGYIALHYPMPATLEELVYYGQLNQADGMRFGIEHFRRLRPHTMGTLVWQLNDCWPVQSWAWVDYNLRPKAAWYAAKKFYAPLLLSLFREGDAVGVHLVNDAVDGRTGTVAMRVIDLDGTVLFEWSQDAKVDGLGSTRVATVELPADVLAASTHALVHATFDDVEASLLLAEPKDLALTASRITATVAGDKVTLSTDRLALSVMVWLDGVDATWSDNFFHLLPGEPKTIAVSEVDLTPSELSSRLRWRTL